MTADTRPLDWQDAAACRSADPNLFYAFDDWRDLALCGEIGGDFWYPEKGGSTRLAKAVCRSCEVRGPCLEYALANDERFGIWGGKSERERRRLKRQSANQGRPI